MTFSITTLAPALAYPLLLVDRATRAYESHHQSIASYRHLPEDCTPSLPFGTDLASMAAAGPVRAGILSHSIFYLFLKNSSLNRPNARVDSSVLAGSMTSKQMGALYHSKSGMSEH